VRVGEVFVESAEKKFPDSGFSQQGDTCALRGRKRLLAEERSAQDRKGGFGFILNEIWKSRVEILAY